MNIRNIIMGVAIGSLMLAAAAPAFAADWEVISKGDPVEIDTKTLKLKGNGVWVFWVRDTENKQLFQYEMNCKAQTTRELAKGHYGREHSDVRSAYSTPEPIIPDSVGENLSDILCR